MSEDEPKLKYSKLPTIFSQKLTTFTSSSRFIAVGTLDGQTMILDSMGTIIKEFYNHKGNVNDLSIDSSEEFIVSAGEDGQVITQSLYSTEQQITNHKQPIIAIQLQNDFKQRGILSGSRNGELVLISKGWFGNSRLVIEQQKTVLGLTWNRDVICWVNEVDTKFYCTRTSVKFGEYKHNCENGVPRFSWITDNEVVIGQNENITVVCVENNIVVQKHKLLLDYICCGIAKIEQDLIILGIEESQSPEIHIMTLDGVEIANDLLAFKEQSSPTGFHLGYQPADQSYYIVSPNNVIVARLRDTKDHVQWQIDHDSLEGALEMVEASIDTYGDKEKDEVIISIGSKLLKKLLNNEDFEKAAALTPRIFRNSIAQWEKGIYKFAEYQKINKVFEFMPFDSLVMEQTIYEMALLEFLENDLETMLKAVKKWPTSIYSTQSIIRAVESKTIIEPDEILLRKILNQIFLKVNNLSGAVYNAMLANIPDQLDMVISNQLFGFVHDNLMLFVKYISKDFTDQDQAIRTQKFASSRGVDFLVSNTSHIPPSVAVKALSSENEFLYVYLDALFTKDSRQGPEFHDRLVKLYGKYNPNKILDFLRTSSSYSYQEAFQVVEEKDMVQEMLYLMGKMGDNRRALELMIERLENVEMAIEFAKEKGDEGLWEDFLKYAMDKPDPLRVIEKIPKNLEIPGLKNAIIKTMVDCSVQLSLREGCQKILWSDIWDSLQNHILTQSRGFSIQPGDVCNKCELAIDQIDDHIIIFCCRHLYHADCVQAKVIQNSDEEDLILKHEASKLERSIGSLYARRDHRKHEIPLFRHRNSQMLLDPAHSLSCPNCK